jgi:hypothetical protein
MIKRIAVVSLMLIASIGTAQKNNTSAYSFFGIGDKNSSSSVEHLSMGGVGVAMGSPNNLNISNPAAAATLFFTNYALGVEGSQIAIKDDSGKENAASAYLRYLTLGFPLGSKAGMYFGITPNSSVGYSLLANEYDVNDEVIEASLYEGDGGSNRVFAGFGVTLFKGFRVGLEGSYVFGKIENSVTNQILDVALATRHKTSSTLKGTAMKAGFQLDVPLKNDLFFHAGSSFELESEIDTEGQQYLYSLLLGNFESPRDTILNQETIGILRSPLRSNIGVGLGKQNRWFVGADLSFQEALELEGAVLNSYNKINYEKYTKFAVGGYFIPDYNSITSYWNRVVYRAGIRMEQSGLQVDPSGLGTNFTTIKDFGISFGVGLPMKNAISSLNLGVELGKRGKATGGLVQENYINFRLSLSLGDKWFKKLEIL